LRQNFSQSGLSHIMAISGMHISILAALVMSLFLNIGLSRRKSFWSAGLFLVFYIILIGLPASAVRAGIMGFLALWAMRLGRLSSVTNSLVLAASLLLLFNPRLLRDDIGFQLSFLAVLGMVWFKPIFDAGLEKIIQEEIKFTPRIKRVGKIFQKPAKIFYEILAITMAAQIFTWPIVAVNFSQVSLVAPLANLLVLWALPVLMILIILALVGGAFLPVFLPVLFLPAFLFLKYIKTVAEWSAGLPGAFLQIDYLGLFWLAVYYLISIWLRFKFKPTIGLSSGLTDESVSVK